jgi:hypothetical protein
MDMSSSFYPFYLVLYHRQMYNGDVDNDLKQVWFSHGDIQVLTAASMLCSGLLRRVVWYKFTDVSEVLDASIIRARAAYSSP